MILEQMISEFNVKRFSSQFRFGAATAAAQIEGAVLEDGRGLSIWDMFAHTPGKIFRDQTPDMACDHYHQLEWDLGLMAELGLDSYRFSIAWSRVMPRGFGRVETLGLDFYERLVDGLLARGITPMATLYHWDLPFELQERGGWPERDTAWRFADYTEVVLNRLGDRLPLICTINEPYCICMNGHLYGTHAPGVKNMRLCHEAAATVMLAHGLAMERIRALAPKAEAGIVMNTTLARPASDSDEDKLAARLRMDWENGLFLEPMFKGQYPESFHQYVPETIPNVTDAEFKIMQAPTDFFGLNYYWPTYMKYDEKGTEQLPGSKTFAGLNKGNRGWPCVMVPPPQGKRRTSMDWMWCVAPEGLTELLVGLKEQYAIENFYITENGSAWTDSVERDGTIRDPERQIFMLEHLNAVADAIEQGVNVKGYYHWSLMDNFEWSYGYRPRFGLYYTDYDSRTRLIKESGKLYRKLINDHREQMR